jgi:predicted transcriptional regulator
MLQVLAEFAPATMTRHQIGFAAGVKHTSGTFSTYWGEIKALGYLAESGGEYTLTPAGFRFVGTVGSPKNTYAARAAAFKADLRAGAVRMLERVMANPRGVSREQLGRETDVAHTSGTFSTYLGELVNNRLVQKSGQMLTPHPWLVKGASNG